jgi:hypothetical protein
MLHSPIVPGIGCCTNRLRCYVRAVEISPQQSTIRPNALYPGISIGSVAQSFRWMVREMQQTRRRIDVGDFEAGIRELQLANVRRPVLL